MYYSVTECNCPINKKAPQMQGFNHLEIHEASLYGSSGDFLLNDNSRIPKVHGGVNGYLSVM